MAGWALVLIGILVAAGANVFGIVSWEVTFAFVIGGLVIAVVGVVMVVRGRRCTV